MEYSDDESDFRLLGHVLVVGGTGFIGTHLVQALLQSTSISSVSIISRHPPPKPLEDVTYYTSSLTNESSVHSLLLKIQPRVIFHLAAPPPNAPAVEHHSTTVLGTQTLLRCASKSPFVKALIYTSAIAAVQQPSNHSVPLTEHSAILHTPSSKSTTAFQRSKAIADATVLAANGPLLRTACLRIPDVYGEGDERVIPRFMVLLRKGQQRLQIGTNERLFEHAYVANVVHAEISAAEALIKVARTRRSSEESGADEKPEVARPGDWNELREGKVDGEAFFITDAQPLPYYNFARRVWSIAGDRSEASNVRIVSLWLVLFVVTLTELLYFIFTAGRKKPEVRRRDVMALQSGFAVSVRKARDRLGYFPVVNGDEGLKRAVQMEVYRSEMKRLTERGGPEP